MLGGQGVGAGHTSKANTVRMHSSTREAGERVLFEQELWGGHGAAVLSPLESEQVPSCTQRHGGNKNLESDTRGTQAKTTHVHERLTHPGGPLLSAK